MTQNIGDRLIEAADNLLGDMIEQAVYQVGDASKYASPIEHGMATALAMVCRVYFPSFVFYAERGLAVADAHVCAHLGVGGCDGCIFPQVSIGEYRVDFLVIHEKGLDSPGASPGGIVVECDGHEFHEKTKKQVARDKRRDRYLQEQGFRVFRFAGSEVWADPYRCASEVLSLAHAIACDATWARQCMKTGDVAAAAQALSYHH